MPFQFLCPQGHLLQGDEAHMGMQTQCPHCGIMFLIPVVGAAQPTEVAHSPEPAAGVGVGISPELFGGGTADSGSHDFLNRLAEPPVESAPNPASPNEAPLGGIYLDEASEAVPGIVHIPCPNGHELETPFDMLGQEVLCSHCHAQFFLRYEDSREYQDKQAKRDRELAKAWFNWAIAAAVLVGGGLLILVAMALSR
jgi:hypothetical protein